MEKFSFDREKSLDDLLAELPAKFPPETFVHTECFTIKDRDEDEWRVVCYDGAEEIAPGFEERFLALLDVQIFPCGV